MARNTLYRFLRYSSVGVGTFLFDLAMLYILTSKFGVPYYISTAVSFFVAVSINYVISRRFVFGETERSWHTGYGYFLIVVLVGLAATTGLVVLLVTYAHLYYLLARILVAGVVGMGNYLINLNYNFKVAGIHSKKKTD